MQLKAKIVDSLSCGKCGTSLDASAERVLSTVTCPNCGNEVKVPGVVDGYLLTEILGRGTSGIVFKALDEKLHRQVALKMLAEDTQDQEKIALECVREARALARLNHPGIVQIHTIGEFRGQHYIVMELVTGGTLQRRFLKRSKNGKGSSNGNGTAVVTEAPDEADVLSMAITIAEGLDAAHKVGLVHMDIKPGNILLDKDGVPKLIDFGAAPYAQGGKDGGPVGTPYYVAPEVAIGKSGDVRSDMYSLGATLFHLLAGRPPFTGTDPVKVVKARVKQSAPSLRDYRDDAHPRTVNLIRKLLRRNPDNRFASYDELIQQLRDARDAVVNGEPAEVEMDAEDVEPDVIHIDDSLAAAAGASASMSRSGGMTRSGSMTRSGTYGRSRAVRRRSGAGMYVIAVVMLALILAGAALVASKLGDSTGAPNDAPGPGASGTDTPGDASDPGAGRSAGGATASTGSAGGSGVDLRRGRVGHWHFDDMTRGRIGGPDAAAVGTVETISGPGGGDNTGGAIRLDGTSYLDVEGFADLNAENAFTLSAWIKPKKDRAGAVLSRMDSSQAHRGFDLWLDADGRFGAHLSNTWPSSAIKVMSKAKLTPWKWQHVAVTYDGLRRAGGFRLYLDGKPVSHEAQADGLNGPTNTSVPLVIGARAKGFARDSHYNGGVDEIAIYDRQLSEAEVAELAKKSRLK